ncbi:MAG: ABC transporter permease [Lachnospiraceae bacterium]
MEKKKTFDLKTVFPFLGLLAVVLFFQIMTDGSVFTLRNMKAVMNEGFFILLATIGFSFVMAEGNLDLSMGTVMAVSCVCAAFGANISPVLSLPFAILPGLVLGWINGFVHVNLKLGSLIATMATQSIFTGILILILDGGSVSAPLSMLKWNTNTLKIIIILIFVLAGMYVFNFTSYGKQCRAVGACKEAANQTGIQTGRVKKISFIVLGGICGLLGFLSLIRTGTASSSTGSELMMNVWCAALLGGLPLSGGYASKYRAVVVGSLTMAFLANGMTLMGLSSYDKQLAKGIVFLLTIAISFDRKNMVVIK